MDGTGELFTPLITALSRSRPACTLPFPRGEPLDYDGLRAFVAPRLPQAHFLLAAESFAGPLAIDIASRNPNITGLILVSTFARHPLPRWLEPASRLIDVRRLPSTLVEGVLLGSDRTPEVRERLARVLPTITKDTMRARTSAVLRVDMRDRLRQVACPVLCIAARKDLLLGTRGLRDIMAARPDCSVELIDGPHMLLETRAAQVVATIERWARRLD